EFSTDIGKIEYVTISKLNERIEITVNKMNILTLNTRSSRIGILRRSSLTENQPMATTPRAILIIVLSLITSEVCSIVNPYRMPPKPIVDKIIERTSTFVSRCSVTLRIYWKIKSKMAKAIGSVTRNKDRHAKWLIKTPDIGGPTAGATLITSPASPIA